MPPGLVVDVEAGEEAGPSPPAAVAPRPASPARPGSWAQRAWAHFSDVECVETDARLSHEEVAFRRWCGEEEGGKSGRGRPLTSGGGDSPPMTVDGKGGGKREEREGAPSPVGQASPRSATATLGGDRRVPGLTRRPWSSLLPTDL